MPALSRRVLLSTPAALGLPALASGAAPGGFAALAQESTAAPDLSDWTGVRAVRAGSLVPPLRQLLPLRDVDFGVCDPS